jgi:hypothetical protein
MDLRIYHFHNTSRESKEHIRDDDNRHNGALCGYDHPFLSSNGDTITLEWFNLNVPAAAANGTVCKKCAKIAKKLLEEQCESGTKISYLVGEKQ